MTGRRSDPRPARSRARLLDAATASAARRRPERGHRRAVTRGANVARATLYRHFPSGNDLLAAAFNSLIPPAPMPPETGSLRERLVALVQAQAELIAETPVMLTATYWLALGPDMERIPGSADAGDSPRSAPCGSASPSSTAPRSTRSSTARRPQAELGEVDRAQAIMLLIGPLVAGRISTLTDFDYRECARKAVDGLPVRPPQAQRRSRSTSHFSSTRIGRCLRPPTKVVAISSGSPASSMDLIRGISSEKKLFISIRASEAPRQKCTP